MSSLSVMEWNAKPPLQWEWETPVAPNSRATENIKVWQPTDWGIDTDEQIASGSLISYQGGCGSGVSSVGTSFDLGYASISKSSKSTSMSSSSTEDIKFSKFSVEACKGYPEDFSSKKDVTAAELCGTSPTLESSVCSGEPLLSLKLGKRTYFEDISDGSNSKTSNFPLIVKSPDTSAKRIKSTCQNMPAPSCQVEGCNIDLSSAKDYHRKHRVCENHSKSPKVIVNGVERRFCQQCSRFHGLAEFDENKRSCRKRLSDHNARRRKPHPDVAHFNPARLPTIIYGGLQQGNTVFSRIPIEHKPASNITWSNTSSLKFMQTKVDLPKVGKAGAVDGRLPTHSNMLPNSVRTVTGITDGSYGLLPLKGATVKILNGGSEESLISSSMDAPQDLHRALSLLSTDSCRPRPIPHDPSLEANHMTTGMVKPWTYGISQSSPPLGSTELWHAEQWPGDSQRQIMTPHDNGSSHSFSNNNFQECLLSEGQHEFGFDSMHLN